MQSKPPRGFWPSTALPKLLVVGTRNQKNPVYQATLSSFVLELDALDHLLPEITESPERLFEYKIEEAIIFYSPFSDLGNSLRPICSVVLSSSNME